MSAKADAKVKAFLRRAQDRDDRMRVRRCNRIIRAMRGLKSNIYDSELSHIEDVVERAYGRVKLGG